MPFGMMGAIASSLINASTQQFTNEQEYQHFLENRAYNEPINQVQRLRSAGLNPVTSFGGYSASPNPPSMAAPQVADLGSAMSGLANRQLRKDSLELARQEMAIKKSVNQLKLVLLAQGIQEKDIGLCLKAINLENAQFAQPYVQQNVVSDASKKASEAGMKELEFANYPAYLQGLSENLEARTSQSNAMANYYTGKPSREQQQIAVNSASQSETARHNKEQEKIARNVAKMSHQDRVKMINVAIKQYNLAVRKQNWDEAHYWYDLAAGAASQVAKIASKAAGWHFGIPIAKFW